VTGTLTAVKVWCAALTGDGRLTSAFPDQTPGTTPGQTGQSGLTALSVVEELVKRQGQGIALDPSTVDWNAQALTRPRLTLATPPPAGQSSLSGPPARACAEAPGVNPGQGLASSQPKEDSLALRSPLKPPHKNATLLDSGQALSISHRCKKKIYVDSCSRGFGRMITLRHFICIIEKLAKPIFTIL